MTGQTEFRWTLAEGARTYQLQVSQDPSFGTLVQDVTTSNLSYTSSNSYPADTALYWRVRANDETLIGLNWSATGRFQRTLARPVISAGNAPSGDLIPTWTWSYVPGAVSYDLRVEEPDGDITELKGYQQTAFTPTSMTGTGAFLWEVRANFPAATSTQLTPGPYSPRVSFTRTIGEPQGARTLANNQTKATTAFLNRVLLSWNAKAGAKQYLVEVSNSKSFKTIVDQVTTDNTAWAPTLLRGRWSGELYWRVTAVDADKNRGAPSPIQRIRLAKGMTVRANGRLAVKQNSTVTVTVAGLQPQADQGREGALLGAGHHPDAHEVHERQGHRDDHAAGGQGRRRQRSRDEDGLPAQHRSSDRQLGQEIPRGAALEAAPRDVPRQADRVPWRRWERLSSPVSTTSRTSARATSSPPPSRATAAGSRRSARWRWRPGS